jgi:hypothetical protein
MALDWAESDPRNSGRVGKAVWPAVWIKSRFIGTSHERSRRWYYNGWSLKVEVPNFEKLVLFVSAGYLSRSQSLYWRVWFRLLMSVRFRGTRKAEASYVRVTTRDMLRACIREMPDSNQGWIVRCSCWGLLWFSSVPLGMCLGRTSIILWPFLPRTFQFITLPFDYV